jgi:hypothetical protein
MDREARDEVVMLVAALLGILLGQIVRRRRLSPTDRARARFGGITAPSLVATPMLARVAGDAAGVARGNLPAQAALCLATGATLTLFADEIARYVPGVLPRGDETGQR